MTRQATPEEIFRLLSQPIPSLNKQVRDALFYGTGYSRTTENGAQHVPRSEVHGDVIEGEFKVIENG